MKSSGIVSLWTRPCPLSTGGTSNLGQTTVALSQIQFLGITDGMDG